MEKLELKHLAPYLPYGLKGMVIYSDDYTEICTLNIKSDFGNKCDINEFIKGEYPVKPILRPLSELKNFENEIFNLYDVRNPNNMKDCLYDIHRVIENGIEFDTCYAFVNWMFQFHFDVFGLIDKGFAIENTKKEKQSIIEVDMGFLVKVPNDIKKPKISNWSDGTTTLEFYSSTYEMEYDSFEFGVDEENQMKEITLPKQGNYKINRRIPKNLLQLVDHDKWFLLIKI